MYPQKILTMKIERVVRSEHKAERILVFLTGGELLRVSENDALRFGLKAGLELDAETLDALRGAGRRSGIRAKAAEIIGRRPLSRSELLRRLREKGASEEEAEDAADWLAAYGVLDDADYAARLAEHYRNRGYGAARIRAELRKRGVPQELWDAAEQETESDTLAAFLQSKCRTGLPTDEKERRRLVQSLRRRGFSWEEIRTALGDMEENTEFLEE